MNGPEHYANVLDGFYRDCWAEWERLVRAGAPKERISRAWVRVNCAIDAMKALAAARPVLSGGQADGEDVERACEVMHDAYEAAAVGAGWETQTASRKPWADVPEANKATMRAAVGALLDHLAVRPVLSREDLRAQIAQALHAWDVNGGSCDGSWAGLNESQRDLWGSAADVVLAVLSGQEES